MGRFEFKGSTSAQAAAHAREHAALATQMQQHAERLGSDEAVTVARIMAETDAEVAELIASTPDDVRIKIPVNAYGRIKAAGVPDDKGFALYTAVDNIQRALSPGSTDTDLPYVYLTDPLALTRRTVGKSRYGIGGRSISYPEPDVLRGEIATDVYAYVGLDRHMVATSAPDTTFMKATSPMGLTVIELNRHITARRTIQIR